MTDIDEMGPIDWLLIEFDKPLTGAAAPPLLDLVDRGLIRVLDALFIRKMADGTVAAVEFSDLPGDEGPYVEVFVGATSGLLGEDDVTAAGQAMENDTRAIMLIYENSWAVPFAVAVREAGGQLIDHGRIPIQAVIGALDELDAADQSA